jgi:hypothetical protein
MAKEALPGSHPYVPPLHEGGDEGGGENIAYAARKQPTDPGTEKPAYRPHTGDGGQEFPPSETGTALSRLQGPADTGKRPSLSSTQRRGG